jgi:hypothetical protein
MLVEVDLRTVENKQLKVQQEHAVLLDNFDLKMHIEPLKLEGKPIVVINYNNQFQLYLSSLLQTL